jgi:hypothetical protein
MCLSKNRWLLESITSKESMIGRIGGSGKLLPTTKAHESRVEVSEGMSGGLMQAR